LSFWLLLQSPAIQTYLTGKLAENLSQKYHTTITVQGVSVKFFNKIVLRDVLIKDQQQDSLLFVHELEASIDSFSVKKNFVDIDLLKLSNTFLNIKSDLAGIPNYQFLADQFKSTDTAKSADTTKTESPDLDFRMKRFEFTDARLRMAYRDSSGDHKVTLDDISLGVSDLVINPDKVAFLITKFQLNDQKGLVLQDFSAQLISTADSVKLLKIHALTANSEISEANIRIDKSKLGSDFNLNNLKAKLEIKKSRISMIDMAQLIPILRGMEENVEVSGQVSGTLKDIKGKNIELSLGNNTRLAFDFYLNGLPDIEKTYMQFDLKQSFADFNDLSKIRLPEHFPLDQIRVPAPLLQAGIIEYKGNFTGFLSDFVAYGTFSSKWGVLNTDLSFLPLKGKMMKINGHLKTVNFQVGQLVQTDILERITFNGDIQGVLNQNTHNFMAKVSGQIDSMMVNRYNYKNIHLNGDILNKRFDGTLIADDANLKFRFDGQFDLNVRVPEFNFNMVVEKADLKALKLVEKYKQSEIAFALNANFTGNNIDNLAGIIHFSKGSYQNENGLVSFDNFDLKTFYESGPVLQVRSDFLDADIRGQYELHNLLYSVKRIILNYLPSSGLKIPVQTVANNFDFRLALKDINRFTQVLIPDLKMLPAEITGSINSVKNALVFKASFPQIQYQSNVIKKYTLNVETDSKLNIRNKIGEVSVGEQLKIYNLSLLSEGAGDVLNSKLVWNNFGSVSYSGSVNTSAKFFKQENTPHIEIAVNPSRVYISDEQWQINAASLSVDSTLIRVNQLKFSNNGQSILVDGSIDKNQENKLNIFFDQIDLNTLNSFIPDDIHLRGLLNGNLSVLDVYHRALYLADLKISGLSLLDQLIGNADLQSRWDADAEEINADLLVRSEDKQRLHAFGIFNPGRDSLSFYTNFDQFSLLILQPLLGSTFAHFHGDATGKVRLYGKPSHLLHEGALYASKAGLMLSELNVNYTMNDSVQFKADRIIFPDMKIQDDYGNSGIFSGSIKHRSFSKMVYDLTIKTNKILAINTTPEINGQFYGKTFASGVVRITGPDGDLLLHGIARTEKGTEMSISLEYEGDTEEYNFLSFVNHGYQPLKKKEDPYSDSGILMKFDIEVTPEAKAQLIYDTKVGDVIKSQGSGNMLFTIDKNYNLGLFGEYTIDKGDYLFTLQNVISKKFEIQRGGTIEWNGDPVDATLDLNAIYHLKASLSDLFGSNNPTVDYSQRLPISCKIALSKSLNNPDIKFDIDLPTAEDRIKDEVKQFISTEEDMNKQMLSLLVLGKFYTPEYLRGTYEASSNNLMGNTASGLLSSSLSSWLSKISSDFDVGVNYRPGNQISNDEVEVALSTQLFNDRVTINGNVNNNSAQSSTTNSNGFVGEGDISLKITKNGKLQLKAYNHANNTLLYETAPYTQGVGVAYREDFNDFNELWQKFRNIFKPKKNKYKSTI
jgi:hypothetical protein